MGIKISNLPAVVTPSLTDIFPVVQSGVTYKETFTQLTSLFAAIGADVTFGSVTFSPTTKGIVGTTTNNNAAAGYVGEYISNSATGIALTANVDANITSISLTAGDWDVFGTVDYSPGAGTTTTYTILSISTTSATQGTYKTVGGARIANTESSYPTPTIRISLAATTTVYLVGLAQFAVSTMTAGGIIFARRIR